MLDVWQQQRRIRFLIANGTLAEARAAWRDAIDVIDPDGTSLRSSSWLALNLHLPVARRWIATGHLEDARVVLDEVPEQWLDQAEELRELLQILASHEEALALGASVYPTRTPISDRWQRPRGLRPTRAGHELVEWAPGRVLAASPTVVTVVVAPTSEEAQQIELDAATWAQLAGGPAEDAAGYFELGRYADGSRDLCVIPDDGEGPSLELEDVELFDRVTS